MYGKIDEMMAYVCDHLCKIPVQPGNVVDEECEKCRLVEFYHSLVNEKEQSAATYADRSKENLA